MGDQDRRRQQEQPTPPFAFSFSFSSSSPNDEPMPRPPPPPCVEVPFSSSNSEEETKEANSYKAEPIVVDSLRLLKGRVSTSHLLGIANSDLLPGKYEGAFPSLPSTSLAFINLTLMLYEFVPRWVQVVGRIHRFGQNPLLPQQEWLSLSEWDASIRGPLLFSPLLFSSLFNLDF